MINKKGYPCLGMAFFVISKDSWFYSMAARMAAA